MNIQTSHDHDKNYNESETKENNHISSHANTPPPSSLEEPMVPSWKWSYSHHQNHSSANPTKKTCTSSICAGLEKTEAAVGQQEAAPGLFQYFRKATDEEQKEYSARMDEEIEIWMERENFYSQKAKLEQERKIWNQNQGHKQLQRIRKKTLEIKSGLWSPGGTKHQVRLMIQHSIHYQTFLLYSIVIWTLKIPQSLIRELQLLNLAGLLVPWGGNLRLKLKNHKGKKAFTPQDKPGIPTGFRHSSSSRLKMPKSWQVVQIGVHEQLSKNLKRRTK